MNAIEFEAALDVTLGAVMDEYVTPLLMAIGVLTATACADEAARPLIASALRDQAESCPQNIRGRVLLQSLAQLAEWHSPEPQGDARNDLRSRLTLIQGGKKDTGAAPT